MKSKTKQINVKIETPKGMNKLEAEALLVKALTGSTHDHTETFEEPANEEIFKLMNDVHEDAIEEALADIFTIIEE